jgi:hypothetical protein
MKPTLQNKILLIEKNHFVKPQQKSQNYMPTRCPSIVVQGQLQNLLKHSR